MSSRFPGRFPPRPGYISRYGEHDRWERRTSPRSRSPTRDRRESRDYGPRDIDTDRAQRNQRDGPASAGSNTSDPPRYPPTTPFRGGAGGGGGPGSGVGAVAGYSGRGRGRGDWDYRGRAKGYPPDDRDSFRPRSHSRGPARRDRERSAEPRDFDRRDEFRDRRDDEWRFHRNRDDRGEYARRDPGSKADSRQPSDPRPGDSVSSSQQAIERPPRPESAQGRPFADAKKDHDTSRRPSAISDHGNIRDMRRDSERPDQRPDLIAGRVDPSRDRQPQRQPSPQLAPVVPQFGSIATSFGSSVWRNPNLQNKPIPFNVSTSTPQVSQGPKAPPTAPRAHLASANPPTAPRADRVVEKISPVVRDTSLGLDESKNRVLAVASRQTSIVPSISAASEPALQDMNAMGRNPPSDTFPPSVPIQHLAPPTAPTGPRAINVQPPLPRASSSGPLGRDASPANSIPVGPRLSQSLISSPKGLPANIPTGPKAERTQAPRTAPTAPRLYKHGQPPVANSWRANPTSFTARQPMIGVKRDANGEEKERTPFLDHPHAMEPVSDIGIDRSSKPVKITAAEENGASADGLLLVERFPNSAPDPDITIPEAPVSLNATTTPEAVNYLSDDDGMDLEEEDFAVQEERFLNQKATLESRVVDLSASRYRANTPIEELNRLIGIRDLVADIPFAPSPDPEPSEQVEADIDPSTPSILQKARSKRKASPELPGTPDFSSLPYLRQQPTPVSDWDNYTEAHNGWDEQIREKLRALDLIEEQEQQELRKEYVTLYRPWKQIVSALDKEHDNVETTITQPLMDVDTVPPTPEAPAQPLATPTEGRRGHKFSSEYDIERVLEESRKEEEKRKEREEREAREALVSSEREAWIPNLLSRAEIERRKFKDVSLLRKPEEALRVFEFCPPEDTFTEEEDRSLRTAYANDPKAWHKIADHVGRTSKECINHYYATKWDRPFKKAQNKHRKARGGPKKGVAGARIPREQEQEQQDNVQVTESGRPRRAAAPRFDKPSAPGRGEGEGDSEVTIPGAGLGKKTIGNAKADGGAGEEKTARRAKPPKSTARKPRNQPLAAKTPIPALKTSKEKKDKTAAPVAEPNEWAAKSDSAGREERLSMPALLPQQQSYLDPSVAVYRDKTDSLPAVMATIERPRSHSQTQRQGASSYWSVAEEQDFKACLGYFGTDFQAIAMHMGTKTTTMIKNHFQKYRQDDVKNRDTLAAADLADAKRLRGEPLGEPPPQLSKRRLETAQVHGSRSLMGNPDAAEPDISPSMQASVPAHGSPQFQSGAQARYGPLPHTQPPQPLNSVHHMNPSHGPPAPRPITPHRSQPKLPKLGYFNDTSPVLQQTQQHTSPSMMPQPESDRTTKERIKTEYEPQPRQSHPPLQEHGARSLLLQQQHHPDRDKRVVAQPQHEQERLAHALSQPSILNGGSTQQVPGPVLRPHNTESLRSDQHYQSQGYAMISGPAQPAPRGGVIDMTVPSSSQPSAYEQVARPVRPQSPPSGFTASGVGHQTNSIPPTPRARDAPVDFPRKRVDIMSMLNEEPVKERPPKRESELTSTSTSLHQPQIIHNTGEPVNTQRGVYEMAPAHSMPGHYPSYGQAIQTSSGPNSHMSTPVSEITPREQLSAGARDSWPGRQSYMQHTQQPLTSHSGSPHMHQLQPTLASEPRSMVREYRPALGPLSAQSRHVPSPPPANSYQHSRTPSYSQQQSHHLGQPQAAAEVYQNTHGSSAHLRGNPYAQPHTTGLTPNPRGGTMQPAHQRNDMYYPSHGDVPGTMKDLRQREPYSGGIYDRGRAARDFEQPHQAPPHGYGQHTPQPKQDPRYPPPSRNTHTPLGHMSYSQPSSQAQERVPTYEERRLLEERRQPPPSLGRNPSHDGRYGSR